MVYTTIPENMNYTVISVINHPGPHMFSKGRWRGGGFQLVLSVDPTKMTSKINIATYFTAYNLPFIYFYDYITLV